ncbi:MAG: hypothetical protein IPL50_16270 [Chitinophagaceae bacterium]|nr:hypothetical protein [Chitinophagaceae bacterium]
MIEYLHGNYEDTTLPKLRQLLKPHITNWKKVQTKDLLNQMEEAAGKKKLAAGMRDVWREAMNCKGRLLLIEKIICMRQNVAAVMRSSIKPLSRITAIRISKMR